jgi:hypothetical protein
LALLTMAILGALGAAYVALSSSEVSTGAVYRDGVSAQYIAEAGARWAALQVKNKVGTVVTDSNTATGATYSSGALGTSPSGGSYTVTIRRDPASPNDSNRRQVSAIGTVGPAKRKIVYTIGMASGGGLPLQYGAFSGKNLVLAGEVVGEIGAVTRADVTRWGYKPEIKSAKIKYASEPNDIPGTPPAEQVIFSLPTMPVSFDINNASYQQYRTGATTRAAGDLKNATVTWNGNNYIDGALSLTGSTVLTTGANAGIYVNGNFAIHNNNTINASGNLAIIANGTITLDPGKINIPAGSMLTLYAKNGVSVTSGATITGNTTIISPGTVTFSGDGKIIVGNGGIINVYTQQNLSASGGMSFRTNNAATESAAITVMSSKNISITGGTPFNPGNNGTVKLYAAGTFSLSGGSSIGGNGLVMAGDTGSNSIRLEGGSGAQKVVFISAGNIYSASVQSGSLIAAKDLEISWGSTATFNQTVLDAIGLAVASSFTMSAWNNQ